MSERESLFEHLNPDGELGADFDWVVYFGRQYDDVGQQLFECPWWAWWRRRKLIGWRRHYAKRVADELTAARKAAMQRV